VPHPLRAELVASRVLAPNENSGAWPGIGCEWIRQRVLLSDARVGPLGRRITG
jgi:hypothetical protein